MNNINNEKASLDKKVLEGLNEIERLNETIAELQRSVDEIQSKKIHMHQQHEIQEMNHAKEIEMVANQTTLLTCL